MEKNEKRHFILNSSLQKGAKIYLQLFKVLEKQKVYDESYIKLKYKGEQFVNNFAVNKNYLYNLLIKSLTGYNYSKTADGKIHSLISECNILFKKALYKRYFKTIAKAKSTAIKYERFGYLIQLLDMEKIIIPKSELQTEKSESMYYEVLKANESIKNLFEYSRLAAELLNKYRNYGLNRDEAHTRNIDELTSAEIMSSPREAKSIRALEAYYRVTELAAAVKADNAAMYEALLKRNEIVRDNPLPFKDYIIHYPSDILYSLTETCINLGKTDEAEKYLKAIKEVSLTNRSDQDDIAIYSSFAMLRINLKRGLIAGAVKLIPQLEKALVKYENKMLIDTELSIRYYIVICRLEEKNYTKALKAANDLMKHPLLNKRADYECYLKIIYLVIHFELKNFDLLKYLIISTYKYLYKREKLFKVELLILEFIRKLPNVKREDDIYFMLNSLGKSLVKLKNDNYEKNAFEYFDLLKWVNSKIEVNRSSF
ncbi:MAG: hypothetical protein ABI543_08035 [Ignavibacteria bacterium]